MKHKIKTDEKKNNKVNVLKDAIANYDDSYAYISILDTIDKMQLDTEIRFNYNLLKKCRIDGYFEKVVYCAR